MPHYDKGDSLLSEYVNISTLPASGRKKIFARKPNIKHSKIPEIASKDLQFYSFEKERT
jgi:hypothetical protein